MGYPTCFGSLELASISPNGTTLYRAYSANITEAAMNGVGGPNMAHIRYLYTTITDFGSNQHYTTLREDGYDAPTSFGSQLGHSNE